MLSTWQGQENLAALRQGSSKNMVGKTPIKVPLNDENAASVVPGKAGGMTGKMGGASMRMLAATPMGPGTIRAPLGNKTTNARARAARPGSGGKGALQQTIGKDMTTKRLSASAKRRQATAVRRSQRLSVRADNVGPEEKEKEKEDDDDNEVEFAPPAPPEAPYESDVFPEDSISMDPLKPENLLRGYYEHFFDPVGDDGVPLKDKKLEQSVKKAVELAELEAKRVFDELDWSVADVPESRPPAASRLAGKTADKTARKAPVPSQRIATGRPLSSATSRPLSSASGRSARAGAVSTTTGPPRARAAVKPNPALRSAMTSRVGATRGVKPEPTVPRAATPTTNAEASALADLALDEDFYQPPLVVLPDEGEDDFELTFD